MLVVSPVKYAFEGLVKNEFIGLSVFQPAQPPVFKTSTYLTGETQLELLGMKDDNLDIWACVLFLVGTFIVFLSLAFWALNIAAKKNGAKRSESLFAVHGRKIAPVT
jgi:ABC-type multidrug transport system permease subunit